MRFWYDQLGSELPEQGVFLALVVIVAVVALSPLGQIIQSTFSQVAAAI